MIHYTKFRKINKLDIQIWQLFSKLPYIMLGSKSLYRSRVILIERCCLTSIGNFIHDDVIKWKHFPRYWPFVRGIHRSRWIPRTKASDVEVWYFLWSVPEYNGWVNNREAGDLRRHRTHYDVSVMLRSIRQSAVWFHVLIGQHLYAERIPCCTVHTIFLKLKTKKLIINKIYLLYYPWYHSVVCNIKSYQLDLGKMRFYDSLIDKLQELLKGQ